MSQPQTSVDWRVRLAQKIEESGKSMRALSLACGRGPGYVHSILKDKKTHALKRSRKYVQKPEQVCLMFCTVSIFLPKEKNFSSFFHGLHQMCALQS